VLHPWVGEDLPPAVVAQDEVEIINRLAWRQAHNEVVAHAESDLDHARLNGTLGIPEFLVEAARRAKPAVFA
jgi:hypothetical protein